MQWACASWHNNKYINRFIEAAFDAEAAVLCCACMKGHLVASMALIRVLRSDVFGALAALRLSWVWMVEPSDAQAQ